MEINRKYEGFREEDFMNDEYFQDWIINPDGQKNEFWKQFIEANPEKKETVEKAGKMLRSIGFEEIWPSDEKVESSLENALVQIRATPGRMVEMHKGPAKIRMLYKRWWVAAAVVLLLASAAFFLINQPASKTEIATTGKQPVIENDIAPGGNRAILTLADGSKVVLDTAMNGALTKQGSVTVIKLDGQLAYNKEGKTSEEVLYNTITTPKGGQYQLVLADGSKVWLNAASSLRFPMSFVGKERKVELTGEGYFEVAKDPGKKFIVDANGMATEVLGTHFNVNSYTDEENIKITLLEGAVKVTKAGASGLLKPGQQAQVGNDVEVINGVDIEAVMAWKNGKFQFGEATSLEEIMRQIARWYDVDIEYKGKVSGHIGGSISRNVNASQVFKMLEMTGTVKFEIDGRKVVVTQGK